MNVSWMKSFDTMDEDTDRKAFEVDRPTAVALWRGIFSSEITLRED